jgi:hypothetical protein
MEEMPISIIAILVATVVNFVFGFIWYAPLFGKIWAKEMGFDSSVRPSGKDMAKGMISMVIGNFFLAYVFAHNIAAWSFVPGIESMPTTVQILNSTVFTWLGFYLPVDLGIITWQRKSWKLFWIDTSYHFLILLIASVILTIV